MDEFLADLEFQLSYEKARRIMLIYDVYVNKYKMDEEEIYGIDQRSLLTLSKIVTASDVRDWLEKAKNMSRSDLQRELKFGDIDTMTCEHKYKKTYELKECSKCGDVKKEKV